MAQEIAPEKYVHILSKIAYMCTPLCMYKCKFMRASKCIGHILVSIVINIVAMIVYFITIPDSGIEEFYIH